METQPQSSLFAANLDFPLQPSRCARDIQRKNTPFFNSQSTIAEAIDWLGRSCGQTIPVMTAGDDQQTLASVRVMDAKTLLQVLVDRLSDHTFTLADFFAVRLSELTSERPSIVYPELDLVTVARRMYLEKKDLLLVSKGIHLSGLVTAGDIFDVMIGAAVLDNALFNTEPVNAENDFIVETTQICCFQQPASFLFDTTPLHQLSTDNTILTALRVLLNQASGSLLLSDQQAKCCQLITVPMVLLALLKKFKQSALGAATDNLSGVLMQALEVLLEAKPLPLTGCCSVLEAIEVIHFNNLSCAAVISEQKRFEGAITTHSLLKAFLDSMDRPFLAMQ